jgi:BirA family biotin operon repressor/biotin-[acetyl-CoA-carboxylase] ligase
MAIRAERQRFGHGQQGRPWLSPAGGVWLSAALPWPARDGAALGLAVAVGLALQLEPLGLTPQIKWPNDLLVQGRKLAGVLPRLRLRGGQVRWARVGIGVNGVNRVPAGAISLAMALNTRWAIRTTGGRPHRWHPQACPRRLEPRVLAALAWARSTAEQRETVAELAEQRLWRPVNGMLYSGQTWQIDGLEVDGSLRLRRGPLVTRLQRQF